MSFNSDMAELQGLWQHKRVRIRKGATILNSTAPAHRYHRNGGIIRKLGRTVVVEARSVFPAFVDEWGKPHVAQITYAGSGGYWVDVELDEAFVTRVCPTCKGDLGWVDDQWRCNDCGDEFAGE